MKVYLLINKGTPDQRAIDDLATRLGEAQVDSEIVDADSPRGIEMAEYYDVMGRPAVMLMREDGSPVQIWQGISQLPTVADLSYLAHL